MPFMTTPERLGSIRGLLEGIEVSLEIKFGASGLQLMPEIKGIYDVEKLRAVLQGIKTAPSPEELRRVWAQRVPR